MHSWFCSVLISVTTDMSPTCARRHVTFTRVSQPFSCQAGQRFQLLSVGGRDHLTFGTRLFAVWGQLVWVFPGLTRSVFGVLRFILRTWLSQPAKPQNYGKTQHFAHFLPAKSSCLTSLLYHICAITSLDWQIFSSNFQYSRKLDS